MFLPKLNYKKGLVFPFFIFLQFSCYHTIIAQSLISIQQKDLEIKAERFMTLSQYDSAISLLYELKLEANKNSDWVHEIKYSLRIVEAFRSADKFTETDSCLLLIENNTDYNIDDYPLKKAEFLHQKGTSIGNQGKHEEAIKLLDQVVDLRYAVNGNSDTLLAKTFNNIGTYYYYLGDLKKASSFYEKALKLALQTKSQASNVASFMQNIGIIYARMGDFEMALKYFNDNLRINKENLSEDNQDIAQIYLNLGQLHSLLGRYTEALEYNNLAEKIYIKKFGNEYGSLGTIYLNKSRIFSKLSDPEEADKYLKNALNIYNLHLKPDHPNIARTYNNLGIIAMSKKNYLEAINYFQKSLLIKKDTDSKSIQLRNLAEAHKKLENFHEAENYYELSIASVKSVLGKDHFEYGNSVEKYGEFLIGQKRFGEAEENILQAIDNHLVNYDERNSNVAEVYLLYGQFFEKTNNHLKALEYFQKATIANNYLFSDYNIYSNPEPMDVISEPLSLTILLNKADAFSKLYKEDHPRIEYLNAGLSCYQDAMPVFEKLRSKLRYESKFILMEKTSSHFKYAFEHYHENYILRPNDSSLNLIFEFTEKNKAAVLLSSMKNMEAIKFGGIPEEFQNFESQLKERISGYENLIYNQKELKRPDSSKIVLWEKRLFELSNKYDSLINVFGKEYPSYYDLKYDNKVISITEVQKQLANDEVVIEYALTDSALFTLVIDSEKSNYYKTKIDNNFKINLGVLQQVAEIDLANHNLQDFKNYVIASHEVYKILFSKFEDKITDKKLIIIPDGKLGYLAFESLVASLPDMQNINYRNLDYLIKKYPISYSYSSTLLFKNNVANSSGNDVLAFAPKYTFVENENENQSALRQMTNRLKPLINAQEEVANVIDIFQGKIYNNEEATETNFKLYSEGFDVLHLAMHTIINDEDPMYSKLVFSMNNDTTNDGYLNTFEIYNLNLNAQLAVLSACNTGSGKILNGEGIMSLARGFIYAGVPSIVMTLWEVDDKSGADIMTNFYSYLKEGQSKDVALQNAKIKYLSTATQLRSHPYFWSAYVNVGNTKPLRMSSQIDYFLYLGILIFVIFATLILRQRKKLS